MGTEISAAVRDEIVDIAYDFFSQECNADRSSLTDATNIVNVDLSSPIR
jgi:hypothetical protein